VTNVGANLWGGPNYPGLLTIQWDIFLRSFFEGAFLNTGPTLLAILCGMPFANVHGSKAVLIAAGFLCFALLAPVLSLEADVLQRVVSGIYIMSYLLVIPLVCLLSQSRLPATGVVLVLIAIPYVMVLATLVLMDGWLPYLLNIVGNLLQTLIGLVLGMNLYDRIHLRRHQMTGETASVFP
ncbi:MAG TPA: hypothetical protein VJ742_06565, partial [Nitrososphaera sp.]|nr:hypothetical protein [Nitrososphaera sp.]